MSLIQKEMLPNEGWATGVLPTAEGCRPCHSCQHGQGKDEGLEKRDQFHDRIKLRRCWR